MKIISFLFLTISLTQCQFSAKKSPRMTYGVINRSNSVVLQFDTTDRHFRDFERASDLNVDIIAIDSLANQLILKNNASARKNMDQYFAKMTSHHDDPQKDTLEFEMNTIMHPENYCYQIFPYKNENNEPEIWVIGLSKEYKKHAAYRWNLIHVQDGGIHFFNFKFNPTTLEVKSFETNGNG